METQLLQLASTFTATPVKSSLTAAISKAEIAQGVSLFLYGQMSDFMLRPAHYGVNAVGAVVLLRLEDWLREDLKSVPPDSNSDAHARARERLMSQSEEFIGEVSALAEGVPQVWVMVCPSNGWIATRHELRTLCRTLSNVLVARVRRLPVGIVNCPPFLLNGECDDHSTDRLGQMPYTQAAFDQLGEFLASEINRTLRRTDSPVDPKASDSAQFATYLAGLNVHVTLSRPEGADRAHVEHMLRTVAGFSLTGEKPFLPDDAIGRLLTDGDCLLISVSDRLADYGPTGFILFREVKQEMIVDAMALSCIVLGKQAEFAVLSALSRYAAAHGLLRIAFLYAATERNQPMQEFLASVADSKPGVGYVVNVSDVEDRISESAVKPGAWTVTLQSSVDDSGVRS
jgi:hypothetical protein